MQLMGQLMNRRGELFDLGSHRFDIFAKFFARLGWALLQKVHFDREKGKILAKIVVQLTRDPLSLALLGKDQSTGELLQLMPNSSIVACSPLELHDHAY